jgi:hypothetical protein
MFSLCVGEINMNILAMFPFNVIAVFVFVLMICGVIWIFKRDKKKVVLNVRKVKNKSTSAERNLKKLSLGNGTSTAVGIDLGTTNSSVSVIQDGHVKIIPDREGKLPTHQLFLTVVIGF